MQQVMNEELITAQTKLSSEGDLIFMVFFGASPTPFPAEAVDVKSQSSGFCLEGFHSSVSPAVLG